MLLQKKIERAFSYLQNRETEEEKSKESFAESKTSRDNLAEESFAESKTSREKIFEENLFLEKGDLPALLISALLVLVPAALLVLLFLGVAGYVFLFR
jgi:hypothetical protein